MIRSLPASAFILVAVLAALTRPVVAETPGHHDKADYVFVGVVEPRQRVQLSNRIDGVVVAVRVSGGESVEEGAVLFEIDPSSYRIDLDVAKASEAEAAARLALARDAARRQATLSERGVGAEARATETMLLAKAAEAAHAKAVAEREAAELALERTKIRAPISGVVGRPRVAPGAFVEAEAGGGLGEIVSLDTVLVAYRVPHDTRLEALRRAEARSVSALFDQLTLSLELPSGEAYPHAGRPLFESVEADASSGSLTTWAVFPNPDGYLAPGLAVRVRSSLRKAGAE